MMPQNMAISKKMAYLILGTCLLLPTVYLGFSFPTYSHLLTESIIISIILVLILAGRVFAGRFTLQNYETLLFVFLLYALTSTCLKNGVKLDTISNSVFLVLLFFAFKTSIVALGLAKCIRMTVFLFALTILGSCVVSMSAILFQGKAVIAYFFPNKSIFGILLASMGCFLISYFKPVHFRDLNSISGRRFALLSMVIAAFCLFIFLEARAAWIGFFTTMFGAHLIKAKKNVAKKTIVWGLILTVILFIFSFAYKLDSSSGRILIYRISTGIICQNWVTGIGIGEFKVIYNQFQYTYFSTNGMNSKPALLADNTYFLFNEYYQILVETGVVGVLLIGGAVLGFINKFTSFKRRLTYNIIGGPVLFLLCVSVCSLFSYPLHFLPIQVLCIFFLALISSTFRLQIISQREKRKYRFKVVRPAFILLTTLMLIHSLVVIRYRMQSHKAGSYARMGMRNKAIELYKSIHEGYYSDPETLFSLGKELYYSGKLVQSKEILLLVKKKYTSHELYRMLGHVYEETEDYSNAEQSLIISAYMVPSRITSRWELMKFYSAMKHVEKAKFWARSIIGMQIKIPSNQTFAIRKEAERFLCIF